MKLPHEDVSHPLDGLRQDHVLLCGELAVLKKAESYDSAHLWQTLRDVCARLSVGLLEHIRREERRVAASEAITRPSIDHYSDYRYLQVIKRYIIFEDRSFLLNNRYQLLKNFILGLHRHMDQQESALFPVIKRTMTYAEVGVA
jgi:hypothetical protein